MQRITFVLLLILVSSVAGTSAAFADPVKSPNVFTVELTCDTERVEVAVLPAGSPRALVLESTSGLIITQVVVTEVESGEVVDTPIFGPGHGEAKGIQDDLVTCSLVEVVDGVEFLIELTGFFTPRR